MKFILFSTAFLATGLASAAVPVDGIYTSVFGGYSHLSSNIHKNFGGLFHSDASFRNGYNAGGRIGYQSHPIRYEFEYTYISANVNHFRINYINQFGVTGNSFANLLLANLYYDFPEILDAISPFLGVGIGYGFVQTNLNSRTLLGRTHLKVNGNAFAYQGTAGLTYNFSENYSINAAYRYAATNKSDRFGASFQAQMGDVGVVYHFDTGHYK